MRQLLSGPARVRAKTRRPALVALLHAVLAALLVSSLTSACGGGPKPGETQGSVVAHTLDSKTDDPHPGFDTSPGGPAGALPAGSTVDGKLTAQSFTGTPTVGTLFFEAGGLAVLHYCTASVVRSSAGNLIATAAHCVYNKSFGGFQNHILFVPGYHDKTAPYGMWIATTAYVDQQWIATQDPDLDVAFLVVRRVGSEPGTLESVTGSNQFVPNPGYTTPVDVVAYPLGASKPVSCAAATTKQSATQLRFACGGFADGSSGGPFLTADNGVVGVVGGYQQGGSTPDISYSSYFGERATALYRAAAAAGTG
jgi:V8-like Glu-specific endopeptidase